MKKINLFLITVLSTSIFNLANAGVGGIGVQPTKQLKFIQIDDVLLNTLVIPTKSVSALTVGKTKYREIGYGHQENNLKDGLGFLIDLSKVQSVDTDHGIINLDDLISPEGAKLLINRNSGIDDLFTKDGELIIFNK